MEQTVQRGPIIRYRAARSAVTGSRSATPLSLDVVDEKLRER